MNKHYPVPPYRVQKLVAQSKHGRVWETVKRARPAVAERVLLMRLQDGEENVRLRR